MIRALALLLMLWPAVSQAQTTRPEARPPPSETAVKTSLRPSERPDSVVSDAKKAMAKRQSGAVCGILEIQGEPRKSIPGKLKGCGISNPVAVRSVAGVRLSTKAVMDCTTAKKLNSWVKRGMKPAVGSYGGGVREIHVVAHYNCRTRNNRPGAKISEHGRGRAIDIAGFRMNDGSEITLLKGWGQKTQGKILRQMWKSACGAFGTVLGPNSNKYHLDHFHFDTARYRSGSYCR